MCLQGISCIFELYKYKNLRLSDRVLEEGNIMPTIKKIKYTLQASVGGAGLGLAFLGGLSFLPAVSFSDNVVFATVAITSMGLAVYTFIKA